MRIISDFDYTLFDTARLKRHIQGIFSTYGVGEELFARSLEASRGEGRDWKPKRQFEILKAEGAPHTEQIRKAVDALLEATHKFLYEDTIPFLERGKTSHSFALVTYGEDSFQNAKIAGLGGAAGYFEKIIITRNIYKDKEVSALAGGAPAIFLEDNPIALRAAKARVSQIITVRVNRGDGRYAGEMSGEGVDYEVKALNELEDIVKNYESSFSH